MECFDISNISTTHIVASMVCFRDGVPDKNNYRRYRVRTVEGQDDFASMAEVVRRRYSRILLEARVANSDAAEFSQENAADALARISSHPEGTRGSPSQNAQVAFRDSSTPKAFGTRNDENFVAVRLPDLIIVDGGKGQLSSACRELQRLGLHDLFIIGLAKEHEEIYRPGRALPLRLPMDSSALRLLQRIRDEAHRFANAYHQLLMKKRVEESILDDCPGVSQNRKSLLLQRFGSVNRLRRADVRRDRVHGRHWPKVGPRSSPLFAAALICPQCRRNSLSFQAKRRGVEESRRITRGEYRRSSTSLGMTGLSWEHLNDSHSNLPKSAEFVDAVLAVCVVADRARTDAHANACGQSERFAGRGDNCPNF